MGKIWILLFILRLIGLYEDAFLSLYEYMNEVSEVWNEQTCCLLHYGMDDLTLKLACCVVSAVLYLEFCARFSSTFIPCSSSYFTPFCSYSYFYSAVDGFQSRLQPIPISIMVPLQSLAFSSKFSFFTFTFSKTKSFHFVSSSQSLALLALCDR